MKDRYIITEIVCVDATTISVCLFGCGQRVANFPFSSVQSFWAEDHLGHIVESPIYRGTVIECEKREQYLYDIKIVGRIGFKGLTEENYREYNR